MSVSEFPGRAGQNTDQASLRPPRRLIPRLRPSRHGRVKSIACEYVSKGRQKRPINGPYSEQTRPNPAEAYDDQCGVAGRTCVEWGLWRAATKERLLKLVSMAGCIAQTIGKVSTGTRLRTIENKPMRIVNSLYVTPVLAALIGCNSDPRQPGFPTADAVEMATVLREARLDNTAEVVNAIENARNAEQAVVFVRLRWSAQSEWATFPFAQFMLDYSHSHPNSRLLFHYIDCTSITSDYSPLTDIPGWQELENDCPLIQGYGELAWLKNGRVLRVEPIHDIWDFDAIEKLIAITDELMSAPERPVGMRSSHDKQTSYGCFSSS